ncbi:MULTISPECIES: Rrf2 family transcriptional regulator [unclassified Polaromonas]|uniref:RrF2 family transcriptional regulator n=1 Tax=unclassified Polaromonas TaxID=2638319 RepID=UPI0018CB33ED|nr:MULTISPECIES: Rrf2 family transcriptional regulator [unclassified Polaromonas]MBG6072206.1 Rrf2 family iron-sulfur cluster assembly transcriptional regulator [Polaromonas sp. CG_9.7]MBG6114363.1 Rrf2 family iron-sulfur cluster assembly transcriptional regulator [Polaromonas sp. CG_9.2]MDH6182678.1 Rrf2 family iron-sulfur cluster assembly transcriptional regulator [Polaromonas sp. CG_23.6]
MLIPKRTRVAVESLVYIAAKGARQPIPAREVAQALSVSLAGLESILRVLREHRLVSSFKGPGGGYQVEGDLKKFTVLDVVKFFETSPPKASSASACDDFAVDFHEACKKAFNSENLHDLVSAATSSDLALPVAKPRFAFRPLPLPVCPRGPNSVFQLHSCDFAMRKSAA